MSDEADWATLSTTQRIQVLGIQTLQTVVARDQMQEAVTAYGQAFLIATAFFYHHPELLPQVVIWLREEGAPLGTPEDYDDIVFALTEGRTP